VWTVLNALRAHDDRFNAVANKIDLNKKAGGPIIIGAPPVIGGAGGAEPPSAMSLPFPWEDYKDALLARMVLKVGDRLYWEQWAKDVARIAERHIERIGRLARTDGKHQKVFADFLAGLRRNINPGITASSAIEMLAQHLITQPIFEALFENYSFAKNNPISRSMQKMLTLLEKQALDKDAETLRKFYDSVRKRVEGITSAQGRQKIVIELYEKFFKTAFPKQVEKLGIVYTPVECVDFIIKSVACLLKKEFNRNISDENVHILDPFTGTGTFIVRLLQNGLISRPDLPRKYAKELHANEIILLAYYIASVNIENAYHDIIKSAEYKAFDGICLTDTFQLGETDRSEALISEIFPENSARVKKQKNAPIKIIIGNPPYSVGQESANDNAQNENYPKLEKRIAETYVARTDATNKNSIYDTYIKAFRWSADRLDKEGGIIAFISNSGWLDGNSADGFRKCLEEEFSAIYVFNLRGNQRTSGELSRREGGKIFGGGSRTPISITFLIKNPEAKNKKAEIYYYDIGDYLDRIEKLNIIKNFGDMEKIKWQKITPNQHGDWLNQRNDKFKTFIPLEAAKKFDTATQTIFTLNSRGFETARDMWVYNFSKKSVQNNIKLMIDNYNEQVTQYKYELEVKKNTRIKLESFINTDKRKISWTSSLLDNLCRLNAVRYEEEKITIGLYRPFCKSFVYYGEKIIHRRGQFPELFPGGNAENLVICVSGIGGSKENSVFIANIIPDLNCLDAGTQCFPLYWYEEKAKIAPGLFDNPAGDKEYIRRDAVSDFILAQAKKIYGGSAAKEDIFYYVYGFLHSPDYRRIFSADLKKDLPHIPLLDEPAQFWAFSKAGRQLAELHLDYEYQGKPDGVIVCGDSPRARSEIYEVQKMRFPAKDKKDAIIYNSHITIENIPPEVYEYAVNGRSPVEWIMERYRVSADKDSGIKNDPNDWSRENNNPRYILDLLLSAMTVSLRTREIIKGLPAVRF
jgi:predicted helicase